MSNISIQLKNFSNKFLAIKNNFVVFFYIGLLILLFFEFLVVQDSAKTVLESNKDQLPSHSVQKVRINFTDYNANLKKVENAQNFVPDTNIVSDPFRSK